MLPPTSRQRFRQPCHHSRGLRRRTYAQILKGAEATEGNVGSKDASGQQWRHNISIWEGRLSELADYCKIHGHCNVPTSYKENAKLGIWVATQRSQYKLHLEGKRSQITPARIQSLVSLGFEWGTHGAIWEARLSELANYRKTHGNCNVPTSYKENAKLSIWVATQRSQYKSHLEGKTAHMTLSRIQ
jgi:hypothetical protein